MIPHRNRWCRGVVTWLGNEWGDENKEECWWDRRQVLQYFFPLASSCTAPQSLSLSPSHSLILLRCHCHSLDLSFLHSFIYILIQISNLSPFYYSCQITRSFILSFIHYLALISFYTSSLQYSSLPYSYTFNQIWSPLSMVASLGPWPGEGSTYVDRSHFKGGQNSAVPNIINPITVVKPMLLYDGNEKMKIDKMITWWQKSSFMDKIVE